MLKDITIGQYYPAASRIHKLDSTTKLVATVVFMVSLFIVNKFWPYLLIAAALFAVVKMSDIPVKFIGLGEKMTDLKTFDIENYIYGLFKDMM